MGGFAVSKGFPADRITIKKSHARITTTGSNNCGSVTIQAQELVRDTGHEAIRVNGRGVTQLTRVTAS